MADGIYKFSELFEPVNQLADFVLLEKIAEIWSKVNNNRYFVFKGAVNWADFPFEQMPMAVSITQQDQRFIGDINDCTLFFEVFTRMAPNDGSRVRGLDYRVQAAIKRDIKQVISEMVDIKYPSNHPERGNERIIARIIRNSDTMIDSSDSVKMVQGVVASFGVGY